VKLFINGEWIGFTEKPQELIDHFKLNRMNGIIHPHCSIYWNIYEYSIFIYSDRGRCTRPLIKNVDTLKNIRYSHITSRTLNTTPI